MTPYPQRCDNWKYDLVNGKICKVCNESTKTQIIICNPVKVQVWQNELGKGISKDEAVQECKRRFVNVGISTSIISMQKEADMENSDSLPLQGIARAVTKLNGYKKELHSSKQAGEQR
jgi:hypothetical protein